MGPHETCPHCTEEEEAVEAELPCHAGPRVSGWLPLLTTAQLQSEGTASRKLTGAWGSEGFSTWEACLVVSLDIVFSAATDSSVQPASHLSPLRKRRLCEGTPGLLGTGRHLRVSFLLQVSFPLQNCSVGTEDSAKNPWALHL